MVKHSLVTIGQLILVTIIILFVSYRVALLMDWVPEGFSPSGLVKEEFQAFKENLRQDAYSDDTTAPISLFVYESLNKIEAAYRAEAKAESEQEKLDQRCGENSIYRFFMMMSGSDPHGHCTPNKIRSAPVPAAPAPGTQTQGRDGNVQGQDGNSVSTIPGRAQQVPASGPTYVPPTGAPVDAQ